jgi:hypothetical protein
VDTVSTSNDNMTSVNGVSATLFGTQPMDVVVTGEVVESYLGLPRTATDTGEVDGIGDAFAGNVLRVVVDAAGAADVKARRCTGVGCFVRDGATKPIVEEKSSFVAWYEYDILALYEMLMD